MESIFAVLISHVETNTLACPGVDRQLIPLCYRTRNEQRVNRKANVASLQHRSIDACKFLLMLPIIRDMYSTEL